MEFWNMTEDETAGMLKLVNEVNGCLYQGDRLNAIVDTVKALRADHELAARLLGYRRRVEWTYRYEGSGPRFNYITEGELKELNGGDLTIEVRTRQLWVSDWAEIPAWRD